VQVVVVGVVLFLSWMLTAPMHYAHPTLLGILGKFQDIPAIVRPEIRYTGFQLTNKGKQIHTQTIKFKNQNIKIQICMA
jgi:hypothetical protein